MWSECAGRRYKTDVRVNESGYMKRAMTGLCLSVLMVGTKDGFNAKQAMDYKN